MTPSETLALRVFDPVEFSVPKDWPEKIGIAAVVSRQRSPEFHPVHTSETMPDLIARMRRKTGLDFLSVRLYPATEHYDKLEINFDDNIQMLRELERYVDDPALIEEAQDFAINFEFAAEEGVPVDGMNPPELEEAHPPAELDIDGLPTATDNAAALLNVPPHVDPATPHIPAGYLPMAETLTEDQLATGTFLRQTVLGDLEIVFAGGRWPKRSETVDLLVRQDRMSLAVRKDQLLQNGRPHPAIHVPRHSLCPGAIDPGKKYPVVTSTQGEYVMLTPVLRPVGKRYRVPKLVSGPSIAAGLTALVLAVVFMMHDGGATAADAKDPVGALRAKMFD